MWKFTNLKQRCKTNSSTEGRAELWPLFLEKGISSQWKRTALYESLKNKKNYFIINYYLFIC